METTTSSITSTILDNQPKQDDGSVLVPCGCGEPDNLQTLWYEADPDNSDGSELRVYVGCGECGSCGPEVETDSGGSCPLGSAERRARVAWNATRRISAAAAGQVPEVKALVDYISVRISLDEESELGALIKPLLPPSGKTVVVALNPAVL